MNKFLILLTFVLVAHISSAQTDFRFGLTASPLLSWNKVDASNYTKDGSNLGFQYGVMADVDFADRYALGTGLMITHDGGTYNINDTVNFTIEQKLQYIEVPLTLKLKTNQVGYLSYYGQFGFTPGVPIRKRADVTRSGGSNPGTDENVELEDIVNYNLALTVGAGAEYAIDDRTSIVAGLLFNNGFTNVVDDEDGEKITLSYIAFRLGVFF